ncbi:DUF2795 domain-containing protein [Methanoculleus thermophilus]|jgi:hypothetical protein|uniref:DUF2795 domain-containing protein n=1 Tax=Methanoculleus thermophilus TaxID=2200 RepID=A0A1G8XUL6_9EURY|nr:DUF2795 domain-containing protein [Methanoculleus thermophilus]SDJ93864.1 Protein of unknown function [Methanoculleus thermophilus]
MEEQLSTPSYQVYTKGIDYPKSKQELISYVKEKNAPDAVVRVMEAMEEKQFTSATDLARAFGEAKDRLEGRR